MRMSPMLLEFVRVRLPRVLRMWPVMTGGVLVGGLLSVALHNGDIWRGLSNMLFTVIVILFTFFCVLLFFMLEFRISMWILRRRELGMTSDQVVWVLPSLGAHVIYNRTGCTLQAVDMSRRIADKRFYRAYSHSAGECFLSSDLEIIVCANGWFMNRRRRWMPARPDFGSYRKAWAAKAQRGHPPAPGIDGPPV